MTSAEVNVEARNRRPPRRVLWIALGVAIVGSGLVAVLATREPATQRVADSPLVGHRAPALSAPTVDGGRVDITDLRGRWVLVNYFATWCVPCRKEHPDLVRFHERHQSLGDAEVVGVVYSDDFAAVRDFRRDHGGTWPMAEDRSGRIALDWGVSGVPESFLVDPAGGVVARLVGGVTERQLDDLLARAKTRTRSTATDEYAAAYATVCRTARDLRAGRPAQAKAEFFDTAHQPIHALAASLEASHRDLAARLLEAKQPVEAGLSDPRAGPQLAPAVTRLGVAIADAMSAAGGERPKPCPDTGAHQS